MYINHDNLDNYWCIDIETDGLDPSVIWCIVVKNVGTGEEILFQHTGTNCLGSTHMHFERWAKEREDRIYVGHNALSFDIPVITKLLDYTIDSDRVVDTMVLSQLYHPNIPGGHSLRAWGDRFKFPKGGHSDWSRLTPEMIEYCKNDVDLTIHLFKAITKRLAERGYSEGSAKLEHQIRQVLNKQEANGFSFDKAGAESLYSVLREREEQLGLDIHKLFPPILKPAGRYTYRTKADGTPRKSYLRHYEQYAKVTFEGGRQQTGRTYTCWEYTEFNIGSPSQRVEKLLEMGWVPKEFNKKNAKGVIGAPKVNEEILVAFAKLSGIPEVQAMADWLVCNGRANMIKTWLDNLKPDGCIHGRVRTCGAGTRRMTHSSPNTANIPSDRVKYGAECRALWRAREGRVLVGVDADALEARMLLHELNASAELMDTYLTKPGIHDLNATMLGCDRDKAKTMFYAFMYGASVTKLGTIIGGGLREGRLARAAMFTNTPGLEELTEKVQQEYHSNGGRIKLIDGGYNVCPSPHAALNYKLQGNGAIVMKQAAVNFDRDYECGFANHTDGVMMVGNIHDEWQIDSPIKVADYIGAGACYSLEEAGEELGFILPITGNYKIGETWNETH